MTWVRINETWYNYTIVARCQRALRRSFADVDDYVTGACLWPTPYLTYSLGMHGDGKLRCSVTADETFKAAFAVAAMAATTGFRAPAGAAKLAGNIGVGSVKRGSLIGW